MPLDVLSIGDVVVDDFIRLEEASVHCTIHSETCEICMRWGDKIPFEFSLRVPGVGNAANAAVAMSRLGLKSTLRAYVGNDVFGKECIDSLIKERVETDFVEIVEGKSTNYHYVLWFESERTILIKHEVFEYSLPHLHTQPKWVYLSSLGENALPYHEHIAEQLTEWPDTKLAFQPGTFQIEIGAEKLKNIYGRSEIVVCNREEAGLILHMDKMSDIKLLLENLHALGPRYVVITDDREGAYATNSEKQFYYIPMYPDLRPPYERTGAGDAFASSIIAALTLGMPFEEALLWGPINAMSVVQEIGAQKGLLSREALEKYLKEAPSEYRLQSL